MSWLESVTRSLRGLSGWNVKKTNENILLDPTHIYSLTVLAGSYFITNVITIG